MFDRIRPHSRPWTLLAAVALVAFNAGCTSPSMPSGPVVPVASASGAAVPLPGFHAPELSSGWVDKPGAYDIAPGLTAMGGISAAGGAVFAGDMSRWTMPLLSPVGFTCSCA